MVRLMKNKQGRITVDLDGVPHTSVDMSRTYFKRRNAVVLEEVQLWNVGSIQVRVSRLVLRRVHWAISAWRLNSVQSALSSW